MMIPGFRKISARLTRGSAAERREIEAEIIAGFMEALRAADAGRENLAAHLWWAAYRSGQHARCMFDQTPGDPRRRH
jgi:hypothetical protein